MEENEFKKEAREMATEILIDNDLLPPRNLVTKYPCDVCGGYELPNPDGPEVNQVTALYMGGNGMRDRNGNQMELRVCPECFAKAFKSRKVEGSNL